jgi:pimeloyl-ACP methyl ester carboxylesterase
MTNEGVAPGRPWTVAVIITLCSAVALVSCTASHPTNTVSPMFTPSPRGIASVPVQVAQTAEGPVAYRQLGNGPPLLLIMGVSGSIDDWEPAFVNDLASFRRVIVFDNAGIGRTAQLVGPVTITAMAKQTSAFLSALGLSRVDVLGWSMGGMIAQALAVLHPTEVRRLVLAATQPGTGHALPIPTTAAADAVSSDPADVLSVLFPTGQAAAENAYVKGILSYPDYYEAPRLVVASQSTAIQDWMAGADPSGRNVGSIRSPSLISDGDLDALDPVANDHMLAAAIPGAQLTLYRDAGHGFLFQDSASFVRRIKMFLG